MGNVDALKTLVCAYISIRLHCTSKCYVFVSKTVSFFVIAGVKTKYFRMASFSSIEERCHFARINRLLIDVTGDIMRNELKLHIPCTSLKGTIASCMNRSVLAKAKTFQAQIDRVHVEGYKELDLSFLYTLLRNLCPMITPPSGGWDITRKQTSSGQKRPTSPLSGHSFPLPSEQNHGDDIERIHLTRNDIDHAASASLTEQEIKFYWYNLADVCQRMDTRHAMFRSQYTTLLKLLETCPIDDLSVLDTITDNRGMTYLMHFVVFLLA